MADPILTLTRAFESAISAAFGAEHAKTDPALRRSTRADFQANVALALGKRLGKPPRDVASAIVDQLDLKGICSSIEIAGPGFLNLSLEADYLAGEVAETASGDALGVRQSASPETVVIDYSAPNVAKELHVGHLRSTVIGDALARVLEAVGHRVIRQNHIGDWGTPFGMLIEHLIDIAGLEGATEASIADLDGFYKAARAKFDGDEAFAARARARVVRLQGGDPTTLALWKRLVGESARYFDVVYRRLGVTLTDADIAGESLFNPWLAEIAADLEARGLARISQGALCLFPPGYFTRENEPLPLIVRKQDGGYGYATSDLAAVRYRVRDLGATRLVYVVGAPQSQHLAMVYEGAKMAGWLAPPARAEHVAFGSILGPDRKMFKSRTGDTVRLVDLLAEAEERATAVVRAKNPDLDEATSQAVARAVGVGAIKYADLSSDRIKDYIFDWDRMLAFEGNTAPYLMYAHARIQSIFRKAGALPSDFRGAPVTLGEPAEKALALDLLRLGAVVDDVADSLQPHKLCQYLFEVATAFSSFYEKCPVLRAESEAQKASRLALCDLTARVLSRGLALLGIEAPNQM